jgi:hypothetical protein
MSSDGGATMKNDFCAQIDADVVELQPSVRRAAMLGILIPEITAHEDGVSDEVTLERTSGKPVLLTLEITRIVEQGSLDVSIWGSADNEPWRQIVAYPQKLHFGTHLHQMERVVKRPHAPSPKFIMSGSGEDKFDHPTQKPVELMRKPILNHTKPGELVYDPFLGSGTTLAAAEVTGRVCCGLEIDPKYVDVVVERWQALSGEKATLEGDGRTFDAIAQDRMRLAA